MEDAFLKGETARELDFYRIRDDISGFCISEEGRLCLLEREPCSDKSKVEELKALGREWSAYIHSSCECAIKSWEPVGEAFRLLGTDGAQLSQEQIFRLGIFCVSCMHVKSVFSSAAMQENSKIQIPHLEEKASSMPDLSPAREKIFSVLSSDGEVKDLPALRAIRARILSLRKDLDAAVRRYASDPVTGGALQSTVPVLRNDRQLLAVRADHRGDISGIIHEVSASGQTLFIEPSDAVIINNELIQQEFQLNAELKKIFRELTESLGAHKEDFMLCHKTMLLLDSAYAAARWQDFVHGVFAEHCERGSEPPAIIQARHPLLKERAVPVDIKFLADKNVLIITGPNTGGKTVTLKTIALFALLNQAGFPVPAAEGTRLPLFTEIFADIGDEQSIDESLSTFSAHMRRIARMIEHATDTSLVLLDELGSGTDPQEGGAIAMAALDTLIERGSFVIVTTHHGILKNYGYTNARCINASVEFDSGSLSPTYRLLMGVPGESHALDIAERSGLSPLVIEKARSYISSEQADVSSLIKGLSEKHAEVDSLLVEQKERSFALEQKAQKLDEKELRLKERHLELCEREHSQSSEFLRETRSLLENLVRELREGEITREKTLSVRAFINNVTEQVDAQESAMEEQRKDLAEQTERIAENGIRISSARERSQSGKKKGRRRLSNAEALRLARPQPSVSKMDDIKSAAKPYKREMEPGMEVLFGNEKRRGILIKQNKNQTWQVQFGSLKMSVPQSQLSPVFSADGNPVSSPAAADYTVESSSSKPEMPAFELRLLGMRYEDAVKALERQLDLCAIRNFKSFSVIHGKGNGVLQQGVHDYLSHYPGVKEFHFARPEDGGFGKTYVSLE
ncbi:MAG: Smr/MutS family protein [Treponema sp.]|nr:Smr/MutS family protein [Treponema sp.]